MKHHIVNFLTKENGVNGKLILSKPDSYTSVGQIRFEVVSKKYPLKDLTYDMEVRNLDGDYTKAKLVQVKNGIMEEVEKGTYTSYMTKVTHPTHLSQVSMLVKLKIKYAKPEPMEPPMIGPTFSQRMKTMLFDEETSDALIICGEEKIPCHKIVLCSTSTVFKQMFLEDAVYLEGKSGVLEVKDFSAQTIRSFLKYLYTDAVSPDEIDLDLLRVADKYDLKRLVNECVRGLKWKINPQNVFEIMDTARLLNNKDLLDGAMSKIQSGMKPTLY